MTNLENRMITMGDGLSLSVSSGGRGRTVLVLHGGAGPANVAGLAEHLLNTSHVVLPTHPGWDGRPRPEWLSSVAGMAHVYCRLIERLDHTDVVVMGSSMGGWIGAEMALRAAPGRVAGLVVIDGVGISVPGEPITNLVGADVEQVAAHSYHDPSRFAAGSAGIPPEEAERRRGNTATMLALAGDPYMHDPDLVERLGKIAVPSLVVWGESDGIVPVGYGRAYAAALNGAPFSVVPEAGHVPHVENPAETFRHVDDFLAGLAPAPDRALRHARRSPAIREVTMPDTQIAHPTGSVDANTLKRVVSNFCSGLTVVTAYCDEEPVGMTCQSFFSLSLDPPLIAISPSVASTSYPRISGAGRFAVNVLSDQQERLCAQFTRSGTDKWAGVAWRLGPSGSPLLDGALATIECEIDAEYAAGDHFIVVGRVLQTPEASEGRPLLYFRSSYSSLAS
jgi:flavin reductase (DIM6/NTAB) family NADH-FMN oxidoreductase RutF/pimeloyl-ACP methyl ester carboxylesterase